MNRKKEFKKKLEDLIKDESGNISKDKVIKIGLGTVSALGILSAVSHTNSIAMAQTEEVCEHSSHTSHTNY